MTYPLEVVAEKGMLQRMLELPAIKKTSTAMFPRGKVTVRTNRLPSPTDSGSYSLYYVNPDNYRAVCVVAKLRDWSQGYQNVAYTSETYYQFNSGCVKQTELDAFVQTLKMIEAKVASVMRKETREQDQED
jgi:hypothetical protein